MTLLRRTRLTLAVTALAALTACGTQPAGGTSPGDGNGQAEAPPADGPIKPKDKCPELSGAAAKEHGLDGPGKVLGNQAKGDGQWLFCAWSPAGEPLWIQTSIDYMASDDVAKKYFEQEKITVARGGKVTDLPGVGDEAAISDGDISVFGKARSKSVVVSVQTLNGNGDPDFNPSKYKDAVKEITKETLDFAVS